MNIPLMIVPEPVDKDMKVALGANQVDKGTFQKPPIMPERGSFRSQTLEYVQFCFFPNNAESFPDARVSHEEFREHREVALEIFVDCEF
ncbi:UNVERIFIED_CONTAM: hypothetical protein Slati_3884200 [Sesamum latifolium]|uniref:Uncharacterized protein n=1 Tax=Sesamum latifolium TaxID=2727402 RepID=A0AAW2TL93_9LAMI